MHGLRLYIPPFAPDTAGAAAAIYAMGGLVIILDAGGCAGNICAFDEPRWAEKLPMEKQSAVFSAGLRDMDAILGRDERLLAKLVAANRELLTTFAAIIGTPVPSVIGTDLPSLRRLAEKKIGLPVVTVETDGTKLYDDGISRTLLALFETFARPPLESPPTRRGEDKSGAIGVLGLTPLDFPTAQMERLKQKLLGNGWRRVVFYGIDGGIDGIAAAREVERNLVVTAAGESAAVYLEKNFGTPFAVASPFAAETLDEALRGAGVTLNSARSRILIVHEQFRANALRDELLRRLPSAQIICGTWFMQHREYAAPDDVTWREEDEWQNFVERGNFDCILADRTLQRAIPFYKNVFVDLPHFAVSGGR